MRHYAGWADLNSIIRIQRERREQEHISLETAYYISSLSANATLIVDATQHHWGIENSVHWSLDVTFHEDDIRIYAGYGAENLATVRKIARNALKQEKTRKLSLKNKRALCAIKPDYLMHVLECGVKDVS